VPVSFPVAWDDLDRIAPGDFTIRTAPALEPGPWLAGVARQALPAELVAEGTVIPGGRVAAMHEGRRRRRA
jgi:hypothetical protein